MATSDSQSRFVATDSLTRDFLTWLTDAPRTYADAMEVWRTSCPRFSIWEDALAADLIQIMPAPGAPYTRALVVVTPRGRAVLDGSAHAGSSPRTPLA
jgi:hypothetical protein